VPAADKWKERVLTVSTQKPSVFRNGPGEWLRAQETAWKQRSVGYGRLDWVRKNDFIQRMVEFCEPQPDWKALDVGTGPGIIAAALKEHVARVVGIDLSPEMVSRAMEQHRGSARMSFAVGDAEKLEFLDETFDLATSRMVFHHVADCPAAATEIWRTLKFGGRFVLCEGVPPDHLTRPRYEEIFALKEKRHTFSEAELITLFDHAGFDDILVKPYFMRQVSLNNWLGNDSTLAPESAAEIRRLHVEANDHFKRVYQLTERDGDVFMDWKFIFIRGTKPENSTREARAW
jgi:ubiquinone/menaquinone biosynthesis C-methylase UbiE